MTDFAKVDGKEGRLIYCLKKDPPPSRIVNALYKKPGPVEEALVDMVRDEDDTSFIRHRVV